MPKDNNIKPKRSENKLNFLTPHNPLISPRFADIATFGRLPHKKNLSHVDVCFFGIPFDGASTFRPGARLGPRAVRQASALNRNANPYQKVEVFEKLSVVDYGDINIHPLNIQETFRRIESFYEDLLKKRVIPLAAGGDHSVLLPILRAISKIRNNDNPKEKRFGLIHFDAHSDTADQAWGEMYHHGTPIRRAIEEKLIQGEDIFQIGIRGPLTSLKQEIWDREQGIHQLHAHEMINPKNWDEFRKKILSKKIPFYLTFDMDCIDPAFAPGTGTPVVGGPTSAQAISILRSLSGLEFIGFDCVEICPAYDVSEITSLLASAILFECLSLLAVRRKEKLL